MDNLQEWIITDRSILPTTRVWKFWVGKWKSSILPGVSGTIEVLLIDNPCEADHYYDTIVFLYFNKQIYKIKTNVQVLANSLVFSAQYLHYNVVARGTLDAETILGSYRCKSVHDSGHFEMHVE